MKKKFAIITTIVLIIGIFAGCGKDGSSDKKELYSEPSSLCIGIQNTMGCSVPNLTETVMDDIENTTSYDGSSVTVFEVDGHAYQVKNIEVEYEAGLSSSNKKELASDYAYETISAMLKNTKPQTAEIDILYALTAMSNKLQNSKNEKKHLIIVSNLLSTTGIINFAKDTIYFDIDNYIAEYLQNELPNMSGIDVTFYVAETENPQKPLQNSDIARLKEFYEKLCNASGAKSIEFIEDNTKYEVENSNIPKVSCIDVRVNEYNPAVDDIDIVLEESALFLSNSTDFVDETKTEKDLKNIVKTINDSEGKTLIFGSTATTNSSSTVHLEFALKRAKTIYNKLLDLGADKNKLEYYSLGKEKHPYRINDTGQFDTEKNHAMNRCVFIVSENLDKGKTLKSIAQNYAINW